MAITPWILKETSGAFATSGQFDGLEGRLDEYDKVSGTYLTNTSAAQTYLAKTVAESTYAKKTDIPSVDGLLSKTEAASTYQPIGNYATTDAISDMETKTHAAGAYLTKNSADTLYASKTNSYVERSELATSGTWNTAYQYSQSHSGKLTINGTEYDGTKDVPITISPEGGGLLPPTGDGDWIFKIDSETTTSAWHKLDDDTATLSGVTNEITVTTEDGVTSIGLATDVKTNLEKLEEQLVVVPGPGIKVNQNAEGTELAISNTLVSGSNLVAGVNEIGTDANVNNGMVIGFGNSIGDTGSSESQFFTLLGKGNEAYDIDYSITNGQMNSVSGNSYSIMNGNGNKIRNCEYNFINGQANSATQAKYDIIAGNSNRVSGTDLSVVIGDGNRVANIGTDGQPCAGASHDYVYGYGNQVLGSYNQVLGAGNAVMGTLNFAIGSGHKALGAGMAMLLGTDNIAPAGMNGSIMMGQGLQASAPMQILMGAENDVNDRVLSYYNTSYISNMRENQTVKNIDGVDYVNPMFVLAGDSNPATGSEQNSHVIYKDGQIMLRFDAPWYGDASHSDDPKSPNYKWKMNEQLINWDYFTKAKTVSNAVSTYSGFFGELTNNGSVKFTSGTAADGHTTYKADASLDFDITDYVTVSAKAGTTGLKVTPVPYTEHVENGKAFELEIDAGGIQVNTYSGGTGIDINTSNVVSIDSDTQANIASGMRPDRLYRNASDVEGWVRPGGSTDGDLLVATSLTTWGNISCYNGSIGKYNAASDWSRMIKPVVDGTYLTETIVHNSGLALQLVAELPDEATRLANPNVIYAVVE